LKPLLGKKINFLWLKYKLYDVLDVNKTKNAPQREAVSAAFDKFDFASSSLE
jgi:hypothetical protein